MLCSEEGQECIPQFGNDAESCMHPRESYDTTSHYISLYMQHPLCLCIQHLHYACAYSTPTMPMHTAPPLCLCMQHPLFLCIQHPHYACAYSTSAMPVHTAPPLCLCMQHPPFLFIQHLRYACAYSTSTMPMHTAPTMHVHTAPPLAQAGRLAQWGAFIGSQSPTAAWQAQRPPGVPSAGATADGVEEEERGGTHRRGQ